MKMIYNLGPAQASFYGGSVDLLGLFPKILRTIPRIPWICQGFPQIDQDHGNSLGILGTVQRIKMSSDMSICPGRKP